ncbi:MAG: hypothetical protein FWH16_05370 [Oscillospiraceae bacterium]|nr:hypothetical protein [Oscillospiraceae bacterium]
MKKFCKILFGLFIALVTFGLVATIALRYLDVILGFFNKGECLDEDCDCGELAEEFE